MKTIWKFVLPVEDFVGFEMPRGAQILTVQVQNNQICMWALVDPTAPKDRRHFQVVGTGHPFKNWQQCNYIGSVQMLQGELVFHVYEMLMGYSATKVIGTL